MSTRQAWRRFAQTIGLLLCAAAPSVQAASFTDDFSSSFAQGTTVTRSLGGQTFTFAFVGNGDLAWDNDSSPGNPALSALSALEDPAIERVDIARTDGADFVFNGIHVDVLMGATTTVQAYRNGAMVGAAQTVFPGQSVALSFGAIVVDEIRISSSDFFSTNFDNFIGDTTVPAPPVVSDSNISILGASGTGGAYKIGDTVTARWNNSAAGDNNAGVTGVTVDFSQFGGGAATAATLSAGTWTATYTITAGSIDTASRNVSVTATNAIGSTTRADTTNATVDSIAPTVTEGRIGISGASGTGGAYRIGDTVTATWNNTAGGDNNVDSISSATVNFLQFGGGAAVAATNSSGTWTATYTLVAGTIDAGNRNVSVTATDNAGNATTTADASNATVDNVRPTASSIAVSGTPAATATSMAFAVTFSEPVSNISSDDFTLVGTGTASGTIDSVSAATGASINVNIVGITGSGTLKVNLNGGTDIVDDAGNAGVAGFSVGSFHTVAVPTAPAAPTIGTATAGDGQASITFTAPGSNGGSAITTYTATASPGGAFGTCAGPAACTATVTGLSNGTAYTFTVTATNAIGTGVPSTASNAVTPKATQTIAFGNPGAQAFGTSPTLTATTTSGLTPVFSSATTGVCTITGGGVLTFVTAGACTIDVNQAGNGAVNAAATVTHTFTVNAVIPAAPTIGTATAGDTQATVTFTAPSFTGGNSITGYTVTASPGGATGIGSSSPITVAGLTNGVTYTFSVTATNATAGTGPASAASNAVTPASPQVITFANPGAQNFGTTPTLTATADSGLSVSFTSSTTGVCTITSGGALTFVATGTCTINADQAGDSSFLSASQVSRSFTVNAVAPGAPTAAVATAGDTAASIAFIAPTYTGGAPITGYVVTSSPGGIVAVGAGSPLTMVGLTNGVPYTFTVTATNAAGTGSASAASNSITPAATQAITFNNPGAQNFGTTPTLTATADSGLTPVFTSSTTGVCTITGGGALTFVAAGTCTINADQAGNGSYLAAAQVSRSFAVNAVVPGAPVIGVASATGPGSASVSFTAPGFTGASAITAYTMTSSPGGVTATATASPAVITGLTPGVTYTFTVTATNAVGTGAASAASNAVVPIPALAVSPVSATIPYSAGATAITLDIVGTAASVAIDTAPAHGTAVASGTTITYQPNAGYAGADSFSYTATDPYSTTAPAAISITVANATVALAATATPGAVGGTPYHHQFSASGGTGPYSFQLLSANLPAGMTLAANGELSGTPTVAGTFNLTVKVTDSSTGTGPFSDQRVYTLAVAAPQLAFALSALPQATHGAAYDQPLDVSGGTAPYAFAITAGALPAGLTLDAAGRLSGAPEQAGHYALTVQVRDAYGFAASQAFDLQVEQAAQVITAFVANPDAPVFAHNGHFAVSATGGASANPVVFASSTPAVCQVSGASVAMLSAGVCGLSANQAGDANHAAAAPVVLEVTIAAAAPTLQWVDGLHKVYGEPSFELPEPQSDSGGSFTYSSDNAQVATVSGRTVTLVGAGTAVLTATQAASGSFTAGSVQMRLVVDDRPDPARDADVVGGLQAQVDASVRFAAAQQGNIRGRLRQVRNGDNASSTALSLAYVGEPGSQGMAMPVGQAVGGRWPMLANGWGIWAAGTVNVGRSGDGQRYDFQTDGVSFGADRALGDHALIGLAGSMAKHDGDAAGSVSSVDADQRSLTLYGLWGAGEHFYVDGLLAYGQLDFDLVRWSEAAGRAANAQRDGDQLFGSLSLGYEHHGPNGLSLTGYGRLDGSRTTLDAYQESGLGIYDLVYREQTLQNTSMAVGLEGSYEFAGRNARLRPFWTVEYTQALENQGLARINYAQQPVSSDYGLRLRSYYDDLFSIGAGMDIRLQTGWLFTLLVGHEQGGNSTSANSVGVSISYGAGAARPASAPASSVADQEPACSGRQCRRQDAR
ncbi:autotransporter domain-containing protein [Lysobacter sp. TAF61]|uniref:autotransporter domain-containing protein n=1 Tax=Lysobacter sp. TAF61 TaxID=3233072 RepID=UPI003F97D538